MRLIWAPRSTNDLLRLHRFLAPRNRRAATDEIRALRAVALGLIDHPRLGKPVESVEQRDISRLFVRNYELRYEVRPDMIVVLRVWHIREDR